MQLHYQAKNTSCVQHEGTNNPHQQASQHIHKGRRKERDWVIPKMNVPHSFWARNTKPVKGNIGIIWWGIPNVPGELDCWGLNDKYMLLVVERVSAGCPKVLCGWQQYSICPWRCWLKMLSSAWVVFCAEFVCEQYLIWLWLLSVLDMGVDTHWDSIYLFIYYYPCLSY